MNREKWWVCVDKGQEIKEIEESGNLRRVVKYKMKHNEIRVDIKTDNLYKS